MTISQVIETFGSNVNGTIYVSPRSIYARTEDEAERKAACDTFNRFIATLRQRTFTKNERTDGKSEFSFAMLPNEEHQMKLIVTPTGRFGQYGEFKDKCLALSRPLQAVHFNSNKVETYTKDDRTTADFERDVADNADHEDTPF